MLRGKQINQYEKGILKGIQLHKEIDKFTDSHIIVKDSIELIKPNQGRWAPIIVDIMYDHFLAKNWMEYSDVPLADYIQEFYKILRNNFDVLPANIQKMAPLMMDSNWLLSYANLEGIDRVLGGMNRRTKNKSGMDKAGHELKTYYTLFEADFKVVMKDLQKLSTAYLAA